MTVANQYWDYTSQVNTSEGPTKVGPYASRTSSGSNSPRLPSGVLSLVENDYSARRYRYYNEVVLWKFPYQGSFRYTGSAIGALPQCRSDWTSNDELALWGKLCEKIRGHDFNLAVFIGEGRESLQMISSSTKKIEGALVAVAQKRHRRARRILGLSKSKVGPLGETFASHWLAYSLGWAPLAGDIYNAAVAIHSLTNRDIEVEYFASSFKPQIWGVGDQDAKIKRAYTRCKLRAIFSAPIPAYQTLGMFAPETTTWEALPATWILDYIAPVGDYLATVGLLSRVSPAKGYYLSKLENSIAVGLINNPKAVGPSRVYQNNDLIFEKRSYYARSKVNLSSVPFPRFKPLGDMLDWKRALNVVTYAGLKKAHINRLAAKSYGQ